MFCLAARQVCNTVMTAHLVLAFAQRGVPQIWILHEWWPREMLEEELAKRALSYLSQQTVDEAMKARRKRGEDRDREMRVFGRILLH